jgi:ribosomal protein L32
VARIDVSIEHRNLPEPATNDKPDPNTCPTCGSHYRDDELSENLRVCPQCGRPKRPHRVCPTCGTYAGREVVSHAIEEPAPERAAEPAEE